MNLESLKLLLNNVVYKRTLSLISENASIKVNYFVNTAVYNIGLRTINSTIINEEEIYDILLNRNPQFSEFCIRRIKGFKNLEIEQDYPQGEEPEEGDREDKLEDDQLSIISLLGYLIEFYHLEKSDSIGLVNYLKKIKLPKAEKHKREIEGFFRSVSR